MYNIRFNERPAKALLSDLYNEAHLFVFASTSDTQGLVLAEAMASGTPVIALDGPGQRDLIKPGINGFIIQNQEEMGSLIERITQNKLLYDHLQKGSFESAQNYRTTLKQLLNFYHSILL